MNNAVTFAASAVTAIALLATMFVGTAGASDTDAHPQALEYVLRDKIVIRSDAEFTDENGVVSGTGSSDDPYIIEGWEIVFNGSNTCILVADTGKHFVIRNVHLSGGLTGVRLNEVDHARITDCIIDNCSVGVSASYADVSSVDNCAISNCSIGISLLYCDEFSLRDNTMTDNTQDLKIVSLPWITTRQANLVFAAIVIAMGAFVGLLIYMRYRSGRPPKEDE